MDVSEQSQMTDQTLRVFCADPLICSDAGSVPLRLLDSLRDTASLDDDLIIRFDHDLQHHAQYPASELLYHTYYAAQMPSQATLSAMAETAIKHQNTEMAADRLRFQIESAPQNLHARLRLVQVHIGAGDFSEALAQLGLLKDWPDDPRVQRITATVYAATGEVKRALAFLDAALSKQPDQIELQIERFRILSRSGHRHEAETGLKAIVQAHPERPAPRRQLAQSLMIWRDYNAALAQWRAILALLPTDKAAQFGTLRCLFETSDASEAQAFLDTISPDLDRASIWQFQIWLLIANHKKEEALAYIDHLIQSGSTRVLSPAETQALLLEKVKLLISVAKIPTTPEHRKTVDEVFTQILDLRPITATIRKHYADALIKTGRFKEASAQINLLPDQPEELITSLHIWNNVQDGDVAAAKSRWAAFTAKQFLLSQQPSPPDRLTRIDELPIADRDGAITLFTTIKNERNRLPWFLMYYRSLGVSRFVVIDNCSTDQSRAYLQNQPDVHLYLARDSFAEGCSGVRWINELTKTFATRGWVLYADVDEALVFPGVETHDLHKLTTYMDRHDQEALGGFMLDMFADPAHPPSPMSDRFSYVDEYRLFENSYDSFPNKNCPYYIQHGGVRRHFGGLETLTKTPLFRGGRDIALRYSSHVISPATLSDVTCALLHYKFIDQAAEAFSDDLDNGTRSGKNQARYRNYLEHLEEGHPRMKADPDKIIRFEDSVQLSQLGLITCPDRFAKQIGDRHGY